MAERLTKYLDPRILKPTVSDIARAIDKPVEKVSLPDGKQWKWRDMFYALVEGEGARFGSYRALDAWLQAVIQMLTSCSHWETLAEMLAAVQWELQQNYPYPEAHLERLKELLLEQKVRLEQLKAQAGGLIKAWKWAKSWAPVIEYCPDQKSLNLALQLYQTQKQQFQAYAEVFEFIGRIEMQQRAYLRSLEAA